MTALKPLSGVRIVDMSRMAPGPYCTMLLADLGAEVIVVGGGRAGLPVSSFARGKDYITLDLKSAAGQLALAELVKTADVFVESFRPGVAARLGAGYAQLSELNDKLIYCSLTGYGQHGPLAREAGHDINYLALTGILGAIGPAGSEPTLPLNLLADFAGGSLFAAIGILAALYERKTSGKGQHIDAAMIDGCLSLMSMHYPVWNTPVMPARGKGWLTGEAPYYRCYRCADDKYVSVGPLEPQFFAALWNDIEGGAIPDHMTKSQWPRIEKSFEKWFLTRPRDDWARHYAGMDACVFPVLDPDEVWQHPHIQARYQGTAGPESVPTAPRFSRSELPVQATDTTDKTEAILAALGISPSQIAAAYPESERSRVHSKAVEWPPILTDE
ncbi:CaiB/BaiF CoA transferase family protein [Massilia brevitalea]|uniref:CaiB/BaiF CoA transferase family protein n=1 Tax=Massilia brevitalea TaxID=442526 RepID=UPI002738ED55|nr:CaiB/BaiF CoA-transferase family protein [Massilia brevitalea]